MFDETYFLLIFSDVYHQLKLRMMTMSELKADLFDNPMGLQGFDFVEFVSPEPELVERYFATLALLILPITAQKMWLCFAKAISTLF